MPKALAQSANEVTRVAQKLVARVVDGSYPPGLRMPSETDLAKELACGRSTIREALRHLTGLGLVRSRRGSGALVLDFRLEGTPELLPAYVLAGKFDGPPQVLAREMLRMRTMLAAEAARLAAEHAVGPLTEVHALLAERPQGALAHTKRELSIFRALVRASRVWPAVWLANGFWKPMEELLEVLVPLVGGVPEGYEGHLERIVGRVEARDAEGAQTLVRHYFDVVDRGLMAGLGVVLGPHATPEGAAKTAPKAQKRGQP